MKEYRVSKYNPQFRGESGAYSRTEWTSVRDIGRTFDGVLLTPQVYERVENAYIHAASAFLREGGLSGMRITGLENSRNQRLDYSNESILGLDQVNDVIRLVLREEFWCRLEADLAFVHFGWDFYMYIGVPHPCPTARTRTSELGLYVEEFESPYKWASRESR